MVHNSSHMGISVSVDTADHGIGVFYDGHCHPCLHIRTGVAHTCRTGGPGRRSGVNRTGTPISHPTGECRSRGQPAGHSKDNPEGVSRFASQTEPRELTNRRFQPWVTAIHHDQRTHTSSLPVPGWVTRPSSGLGAARYALSAEPREIEPDRQGFGVELSISRLAVRLTATICCDESGHRRRWR
jgi:hypothetical protein